MYTIYKINRHNDMNDLFLVNNIEDAIKFTNELNSVYRCFVPNNDSHEEGYYYGEYIPLKIIENIDLYMDEIREQKKKEREELKARREINTLQDIQKLKMQLAEKEKDYEFFYKNK